MTRLPGPAAATERHAASDMPADPKPAADPTYEPPLEALLSWLSEAMRQERLQVMSVLEQRHLSLTRQLKASKVLRQLDGYDHDGAALQEDRTCFLEEQDEPSAESGAMSPSQVDVARTPAEGSRAGRQRCWKKASRSPATFADFAPATPSAVVPPSLVVPELDDTFKFPEREPTSPVSDILPPLSPQSRMDEGATEAIAPPRRINSDKLRVPGDSTSQAAHSLAAAKQRAEQETLCRQQVEEGRERQSDQPLTPTISERDEDPKVDFRDTIISASQGVERRKKKLIRSESRGPNRQRSFSAIDAKYVGKDLSAATHRLAEFARSDGFEFTFASLIVANSFVMALEAQYKGSLLGVQAGLRDFGHSDWPDNSAEVFRGFDIFFGVAFAIELVIKIICYRARFPRYFWNVFDMIVVAAWIFDNVADSWSWDLNPLLLRMVRLAKAMRLVRLTKTFATFDSLHLMVTSLRSSISVAGWSLVFLLFVMLVAALALGSFTESFILDVENEDDEKRLQVYQYFGTFSRALVSVIELTIGNWAPILRTILENISEWLALTIMCYQLIVGFSVVKVLTGVFMLETFKVAGSDDEMMILSKQREVQKYQEKIAQLFEEVDMSGDGLICYREFDEAIQDERVKHWLGSIGLEVSDARMAWDLMYQESDKQGLTREEIAEGIRTLKGGARSLDLFSLRSLVDEMKRDLNEGRRKGES